MDTWEVTINANDPMNPGSGLHVTITENGRVRFASDKHPVTGEALDYHAAIEVAGMYGPKKSKKSKKSTERSTH